MVYNNENLNDPVIISKKDIGSTDKELVVLCLKLLNYVATKHIDTFLSLNKVTQLQDKVSFKNKIEKNDELIKRIQEVKKGTLFCFESSSI